MKTLLKEWSKLKIVLVAVLASSFAACGQKPPPRLEEKSVQVQQNSEDLVAQLKKDGVLKGVQTSQFDADYTVVTQADEALYFVKGGKVVSSSRKPSGNEKSLLYWRHYLEGVPYEERLLKDKNQREPENLMQIHVESKGLGIVYDPRKNEVIRVLHFGAKK